MITSVDRLLERARQARVGRAGEAQVRTSAQLSEVSEPLGVDVARSRVFDTVTGQHGEVLSAGATNVVVAARKR